MSKTDVKKIIITQTRSHIGRTKEVIRTLQSLGLGRIGGKRSHLATPAIIGKIRKVEHLVQVSLA